MKIFQANSSLLIKKGIAANKQSSHYDWLDKIVSKDIYQISVIFSNKLADLLD